MEIAKALFDVFKYGMIVYERSCSRQASLDRVQQLLDSLDRFEKQFEQCSEKDLPIAEYFLKAIDICKKELMPIQYKLSHKFTAVIFNAPQEINNIMIQFCFMYIQYMQSLQFSASVPILADSENIRKPIGTLQKQESKLKTNYNFTSSAVKGKGEDSESSLQFFASVPNLIDSEIIKKPIGALQKQEFNLKKDYNLIHSEFKGGEEDSKSSLQISSLKYDMKIFPNFNIDAGGHNRKSLKLIPKEKAPEQIREDHCCNFPMVKPNTSFAANRIRAGTVYLVSTLYAGYQKADYFALIEDAQIPVDYEITNTDLGNLILNIESVTHGNSPCRLLLTPKMWVLAKHPEHGPIVAEVVRINYDSVEFRAVFIDGCPFWELAKFHLTNPGKEGISLDIDGGLRWNFSIDFLQTQEKCIVLDDDGIWRLCQVETLDDETAHVKIFQTSNTGEDLEYLCDVPFDSNRLRSLHGCCSDHYKIIGTSWQQNPRFQPVFYESLTNCGLLSPGTFIDFEYKANHWKVGKVISADKPEGIEIQGSGYIKIDSGRFAPFRSNTLFQYCKDKTNFKPVRYKNLQRLVGGEVVDVRFHDGWWCAITTNSFRFKKMVNNDEITVSVQSGQVAPRWSRFGSTVLSAGGSDKPLWLNMHVPSEIEFGSSADDPTSKTVDPVPAKYTAPSKTKFIRR